MKSVKWHILLWSIYFVVIYSIDIVLDPSISIVEEVIFFLSQNVFLFYILLYVLNKFSPKNKASFFISIVRLVFALFIFLSVRYSIRYFLLATYFDSAYGKLAIRNWLSVSCIVIINGSIYSLAYFYLQTTLKKQKELMISNEEKLIIEQERLKAENALLRSQINPHFLYNTLNFLYGKAIPLSGELSEGILKLSDIMRYSVQSQDERGLVYLQDEMEHLANIIGIHQLRFNNSLQISYTFPSSTGRAKIIPLILLTLVENVLKHGELDNPDHIATITLELQDDNRFRFATWNKKRNGPKEASTGMGVANTIKRLDNEYGAQYTFQVNDNADCYGVELNIHHLKTTLL